MNFAENAIMIVKHSLKKYLKYVRQEEQLFFITASSYVLQYHQTVLDNSMEKTNAKKDFSLCFAKDILF